MSEVEVKKLQGVRLGRTVTVPLLRAGFRDPKPDEMPEDYARRKESWERLAGLRLTVRRQCRKLSQCRAFEIDGLREAITASEDAQLGEDLTLAQAKRLEPVIDPMDEACATYLLEHVVDLRTKKDYGSVLVALSGLDLAGDNGEMIDVETITDPRELVTILDELGILATAGIAALNAQDVTVEQGN